MKNLIQLNRIGVKESDSGKIFVSSGISNPVLSLNEQ
jgi:hypothetical protein